MPFRRAKALTVLILAMLIAGLPALAQQVVVQRGTQVEVVEPARDNRPFLMRLFGLGEPPPAQPPPGARIIKVPPPGQQRKAARPPAVVKPQNPKNDDARVVLVIGDRLAADLGRGLDVAYADRPDVRIETKTVDDAGLATTGDTDWKAFLETRLTDKPRPAAVVAMIGRADGRPIDLPDRTVEFPSPEWETIYKARLNELTRVAREHAVPLLWVGLVPVASPQATNDVTYIDGVIRVEANEKGATYIDVWEPFSQNGAFVASGPDLDGQVRQLRLKDGVGFTRSGARKLAFYVQQNLGTVLNVAAETASLMQQISGDGPVLVLNDPAATGEDKLMAATDLVPPKPGTALHRLVVEGLPLQPVAGRFDATALK
ncbi:hypothetical protein [Pleomorphomonas sp. NRK KF1]|uniref:SGNH/GDSL hydrolase family protein n=1 Tax=Pleomorphomonas sp. NRK KF1 TaxID=2943000 RepID=UPI00204319F4|nr:hypothetical protein [Pleomorphomonas sp. NRK KF1]MCM5554963.1 hypothetical protein [Pleomorphomonas sp. NRK KF1]